MLWVVNVMEDVDEENEGECDAQYHEICFLIIKSRPRRIILLCFIIKTYLLLL